MARKPSILSPEEANLQCPNCGSLEKCKYGKDSGWVPVQRYRCKKCRRIFIMQMQRPKIVKNMAPIIKAITEYLACECTREISKFDWATHKHKIHLHCCVNIIRDNHGLGKTEFYEYLREAIQKIRELNIDEYPQFTKIHNLVSKIEEKGTRKAVKIIRNTLSTENISELIPILFNN